MQKSVKWVLLLAALLIVAGGLALASLNHRVIEALLARRLLEETGLVLRAGSRASFALLPRPQIKIENVSIADASGGLQIVTSAVALKGNLRILALLAGQVRFEQIVLVKPSIALDLDQLAMNGPGTLPKAAAPPEWPDEATASHMPGLIVVQGGTLLLKGAAAGIDTRLEDVNFKIDWPAPGGPMAVTGRARWLDQNFTLSVWLGSLSQWLHNGASPATLVLRNSEGRLALRGTLSGGPEGRFVGKVQASIPALSHVLRLAGFAATVPAGVESAELAGSLAGDQHELALTALHLSLLGSEFDGAITFRKDQTGQSISGTLATETLQLAPLVRRVRWDRPPADGNTLWTRLNALSQRWAVDLRLSAASVTNLTWHLQDAALALRGQAGHLDFELAEARIFGGQVQARASLAAKGDGVALALEGQSDQIDLEQLCLALQCPHSLTGQAELAAGVSGEGTSLTKILESLAGRAELHVANATFAGFDLALALRRVEKHVVPSIQGFREGVSAYEHGELVVNFDGSSAIIEKCTLTGQATRVEFGGSANLASGRLALKGLATQTGPDGAARDDGPQLRFKLDGRWDDPAFSVSSAGLVPNVGQ